MYCFLKFKAMLKYENGEVKPIDDYHLADNPMNALYKISRDTGKKFFNDAIKYAYYMYKKDGVFSNLFPKERAKEISKQYFDDKDYYKKFESNVTFNEFVKHYEYIQYDATERTLLKTDKDIEILLDNLKEIDYFVTKKVQIELNIPTSVGSKDTEKYLHTELIKISNFEEKKASLLAIKDILNIRKTLKEEIKSRSNEQKFFESKSLLDRDDL